MKKFYCLRIQTVFRFLLLIQMFLFVGCVSTRNSAGTPPLKTISIIDRNGMSETISNVDRLKQYQHVDFLRPQPYQKVLRIFKRDPKGDIQSYITSYHPNGQPKQYLEVVNSRAFGTYKEWYVNGMLKLQACVIGGDADIGPQAEETWLFEGHAYVWDEEGNLTADIAYEKGKLQGDSLYYHPNGNIWQRTSFSDHEINGTYEIYLDNGDLLQKTQYHQGKRNGFSFRYWNRNRIATEENYQDDLLLYGRYYDSQGQMINEINEGGGYRAIFGKSEIAELQEYRHGIQEGEVKVFGNDQKLIRIFHVKNNAKHGEEIEYYEIPHLRHLPKLSLSWYEGKIQGIVKTWYDNGVLESNREMSNNAKNGISTAWYQDGSLMLIEEYDHDHLVRGEYFRRGEKSPISSVKDGKGFVTLFDPEGNFVHKTNYNNGVPSG